MVSEFLELPSSKLHVAGRVLPEANQLSSLNMEVSVSMVLLRHWGSLLATEDRGTDQLSLHWSSSLLIKTLKVSMPTPPALHNHFL
jgi:hypothetical protein